MIFRIGKTWLAGVLALMVSTLLLSTASPAHATLTCATTSSQQEILVGHGAPVRRVDLDEVFGCASSGSGGVSYSFNASTVAMLDGRMGYRFDDAGGTVDLTALIPQPGPLPSWVTAQEKDDPATPEVESGSSSLSLALRGVDARFLCNPPRISQEGTVASVMVNCGYANAAVWNIDPSAMRFTFAVDSPPTKGALKNTSEDVPYTLTGGHYRTLSTVYKLDPALASSGETIRDRIVVTATPITPAGLAPISAVVDLEFRTSKPPVPPVAPAATQVAVVGGASALKMSWLETRGLKMSLPLREAGVTVGAQAHVTATVARQLGLKVPKGAKWVQVGAGAAKAEAPGTRTLSVALTRSAKLGIARQNDRTDARRLRSLVLRVTFTLTRDGAQTRSIKSVTFRR